MSKKLYQNQEVFEFHDQYLAAHLSLTAFAKKHNLSENSLRRAFKRLKLKITPMEFAKRKFPVNDDFFDTIDTEEKAYVLGLAYADGCNHETYHKLEISLHEKDEDILIKISKLIFCGNVNVKRYKKRTVGLHVISRKISADLVKLGCPARKTLILKFPELPVRLHSHFIRGYFDGDGMLTIYKRSLKPKRATSKQISLEAQFSIVSTKEMLLSIGQHIQSLGVNFKINKRHKNRLNNNFTLRVHGNRQIKKVCDFLYLNTNIYLERKHKTYLQLISL